MRKMMALERGYIGGRIIEPGETLMWPHENTPAWLVPVKAGALDHDADGRKGGSLPHPATDDLDAMTKADLVKFARDNSIAIDVSSKKEEVLSAIKAAMNREVFGDAPEPVTIQPKGNGLQDALGGTEPDWIPPQPVID